MSDAGSRVSSIASSPFTLSSVSVCVSGAFWPTSGILSSAFVVTGIRTNLSFHENLLAHPEFQAGRYDTGFIAEHTAELCGPTAVPPDVAGEASSIGVQAPGRAATRLM